MTTMICVQKSEKKTQNIKHYLSATGGTGHWPLVSHGQWVMQLARCILKKSRLLGLVELGLASVNLDCPWMISSEL